MGKIQHINHLLQRHEDQVSVPSTHRRGVRQDMCNSSTGNVETRDAWNK